MHNEVTFKLFIINFADRFEFIKFSCEGCLSLLQAGEFRSRKFYKFKPITYIINFNIPSVLLPPYSWLHMLKSKLQK
jgi:hypothetical protein